MTTTNNITLSKPHTGGQRAIYRHDARFQVVACGRRFGKTELGKVISFREMIYNNGLVWWIAPQYKTSTSIWLELLRTLGPYIKSQDKSNKGDSWISAQERTIILPTGGKIIVWSGNSDEVMRGTAPSLVILDEAAMLKNSSLWFGAVLPALLDHKGKAYFLSTPRGRNWFYDIYQFGLNFPGNPVYDSLYKSWNFTSYNNPYIDPKAIDSIRKSTPDKYFRQEYLAEFLVDSGSVFRGVVGVSTGEYREPYEGKFVAGIDWGRKEDFTVVSIIDTETRQQVYLERMSKVDWPVQIKFLKEIFDKWNPYLIGAESNSMGDTAIQFLKEEGINSKPIYMTNKLKREIIELLSLNIEKEKITLLNEPIQVRELQAYELKTTISGNITYNASAGYHDDTVIATGIANYLMDRFSNTFGGSIPIISGWD